jgi:putative sigma-54 modulation protein
MDPRLIIQGLHLRLRPKLEAAIEAKAGRLLHHEDHIVRLRIDLEHDQTRAPEQAFLAKGHIEIRGPDLLASVTAESALTAIDRLVDKLDARLRRRHEKRIRRRTDPRTQVRGPRREKAE